MLLGFFSSTFLSSQSNRPVFTAGSAGTATPATSGTVKTFTAASYGAAPAADRYVVAVVLTGGAGSTSGTCTIGGVSATQLFVGGTTYVFQALVPTGTGGNVVFTSGNAIAAAPLIHVWSFTGRTVNPFSVSSDTVTSGTGTSPRTSSASHISSGGVTLLACTGLPSNLSTQTAVLSSPLPASPSLGPSTFTNTIGAASLTQIYNNPPVGSITFGVTNTWSGGGSAGSSRASVVEWL